VKYNKLVRDKIPKIINQKGGTALVHIATTEEYWEKLKEKLKEEVEEFSDKPSVEELADISEVLDAIIEFRRFSRTKLKRVKRDKRRDRGGFKKRIILEES
jgi:predicted house-cleaning noncanonical NTP pyrophosphatase (MazG superfamily)